eukprot:TRINITY_DN13585_c1_g3_i1.p1 TRINITY_DN13585_c1_g3~~TRINITY_DN13585_c1_g3_i1.p1  ORF type:complete len:773 (+),score=168.07 TRINITY_DN13585_c1_g3_i1:94-2412(+)
MRLPVAAALATSAAALTDAEVEKICWNAGFTRSLCCYGGTQGCFDGGDELTQQACCRAGSVLAGPEVLDKLTQQGDSYFVSFLQRLVSYMKQRPNHGKGAATAHVIRQLNTARKHLDHLRNESRRQYGKLHQTSTAVLFSLAYFVSLAANKAWMTKKALAGVERRERILWSHFREAYRNMFAGHTDFCRCMEAGEFYSHINSYLQTAGLSGRFFLGRMFNGSSKEHGILRAQGCRTTPLEAFLPETALSLMFSTGCIPGDTAMAILLLENCILEQDIQKALFLQDTLFRFATLGSDCIDTAFWSFTPRDAGLQYGNMVWELAKQPRGYRTLEKGLLRKLAWVPDQESMRIAEAWQDGCTPVDVQGPVSLDLQKVDDESSWTPETPAVGPLCTEIGRFWLPLRLPPSTSSPERLLVIIPVTFSWWANPWHHLHWWIAAIWHYKIVLKLDPEQTDVGLTFPAGEANWGRAVSHKVKEAVRAEPTTWSYLRGTWQKNLETGQYNLKPWQEGGLHLELLAWLSTRPAVPLEELTKNHYKRVVVGIPPMRYTVQSHPMRCSQIRAVKAFVESTPQYVAQVAAEDSQAGRADRKRVVFLQRSSAEGRTILNLEEVMESLRSNVATTEAIDLEEVHSLGSKGESWSFQYRQFAKAHILIGVGGGGLGWIWAMPAGGAVIELRSKDSPIWLPCSEKWDEDGQEMFGGLAKMVAVHHICVQPHRMSKWDNVHEARAEAQLSNPGNWSEYDRKAAIFMKVARAEQLVRQALILMAEGPLPCT